MRTLYVDESPHRRVCGGPSLPLWSVLAECGTSQKKQPGCQIHVSKFPLPICSPPVSIRKLPGQSQWPAGRCLWAQSSIQLSVWDYVRTRQALSFFNRGGVGNSFVLWRWYKIHILVHDRSIVLPTCFYIVDGCLWAVRWVVTTGNLWTREVGCVHYLVWECNGSAFKLQQLLSWIWSLFLFALILTVILEMIETRAMGETFCGSLPFSNSQPLVGEGALRNWDVPVELNV